MRVPGQRRRHWRQLLSRCRGAPRQLTQPIRAPSFKSRILLHLYKNTSSPGIGRANFSKFIAAFSSFSTPHPGPFAGKARSLYPASGVVSATAEDNLRPSGSQEGFSLAKAVVRKLGPAGRLSQNQRRQKDGSKGFLSERLPVIFTICPATGGSRCCRLRLRNPE